MAAISIADGSVIEGDLPNKAMEMVLEWSSIHKADLLKIWEHINPPLTLTEKEL